MAQARRAPASSSIPRPPSRTFVWCAFYLFIFIFATGVRAQPNPGGFTSVKYFPPPNQTRVKLKLTGADAQPLPGGLLLIKQLKLETFSTNGVPQAVIEAPECVYDTMHNTANSAGPLQMRSADGRIRVTGDGFLWRQDDSSLTISNHVHTVIETAAGTNALL